MGSTDVNGVWEYDLADPPYSPEALNLGMGSVSTVVGTLDAAITAVGAKNVTITRQHFLSGGTWNKPSNARYVDVQVQAAGGGGGGCVGASANQCAVGGPGTGGVYAQSLLSASALASSETVTVGTGGAGGAAGNNAGSTGGDSSFGTWVVAAGGTGGIGGASSGSNIIITPVAPPTTGTGTLVVPGGSGSYAVCNAGFTQVGISPGGTSFFSSGGKGGRVAATATSIAGSTADGYGGGGSGAGSSQSAGTARAGGAGSPGIVIVTTYAFG